MIGRYNLLLGDCLDKLKELDDNSVDSIVTDPPYGISFMAKKWDYDVPSVDIWKECLRVLKPGGHLLSFSSARTYHRLAIKIEDAGFHIRDQIMWVFGSGFPKSHNLKDDWKGWGTALKPAHEPIVMARKPFKGDVATNVKEYGTGAINIDACRVGDEGGTKLTNVSDNGNTIYEGGINSGVYGEVVEGLGRWPANFMHDGSEEAISGFPITGSSKPTENNKNGGEFPEENTIKLGLKEIRRTGFQDSGSAARYFYCAKASKTDRNEGCEELEEKQYSYDGRNTPIENAYQRNKSTSNNNHPTVKPTELMKYLITLVTPADGIVLDPFMGSGSTGKAAMLINNKFIGIELSEEYFNIAEKRIKHAITKNE